jgi:hypothetical protein
MMIARSVADVLRNHVVLEYEAIDRMYLNVYVPHLQTVGAMVGYLRVHHGQRFASTTAVAPMTEAFVRNVEEFVAAEGIDLITFEKNQRKDEVTQKYLQAFKKSRACCTSARRRRKRVSCAPSAAAVSALARLGRDHHLHAGRKRNHVAAFTARTTASKVALSTPRGIRTVTAPITTSIRDTSGLPVGIVASGATTTGANAGTNPGSSA